MKVMALPDTAHARQKDGDGPAALHQLVAGAPPLAASAVAEAIAAQSPAGPVVIADTQDNPGGGGPDTDPGRTHQGCQ